MRDLTAVRLTAGGSVLVLADSSGVEYAVRVGPLRETLGRAGATEAPTVPQQHREATVESSLRPRDIQARIRSGESPEDVAAVAGTSVEKVMIFASPVLAERAHVAQSALAASVRRGSGDPTAPDVSSMRALGAAVATRLRGTGLDPESVAWDSWRREDGRWTLQARYTQGADQRTARFTYDQPGSYVVADDDDARWLVADGQVPARAPRPEPAAPPAGLRLAPAYVAQTTQPELGDDALDLLAADTADADWMGRGPASPSEPPAAAGTAEAGIGTGVGTGAEPTVETPRHVEPRTTPKKKPRTSVPSWDEIMFGGGS